jgi:hypothetical protein
MMRIMQNFKISLMLLLYKSYLKHNHHDKIFKKSAGENRGSDA